MRRLVVNADDLGLSPARNAGILDAHRRGIVTAASLMANGPAFMEAASMARNAPALDIGIHFNISEGRGLPGKCAARSRRWRQDEVEREMEAQVRRILDAGLRISHVDGHHHIQVYGDIAEPMARVSERHGVRWYRSPAEIDILPAAARPARLREIEEYRRGADRARTSFARHGLRTSDHFTGAALSGAMTAASLAAALERLPHGLTELMVHPGFDAPERDAERQALCAPQVRLKNIVLTSFASL